MRNWKFPFFLLPLVLLLTACASQPVSLHQDPENVIRIDLVYSPFGEQQVLHSLEGDEISPFLAAVSGLSLRKNGSPQNIGGTLIVQIVYEDSSIDLFGDSSVGYRSDGVLEHDGWYCIRFEDLYDLFSEHTDLSELPHIHR